MKWIYVVEDPLSEQAACRTHVLEFCHSLSKIDEVILISQANPITLSPLEQYQYLQIKPFRIRPRNLGYLLNSFKTFFYLSRLSKIHKYDVIYERAIGFSLGPLIFARMFNIPSIVEINGNWEDENRLAIKSFSFPKKQLVALINSFRGHSLTIACRLAKKMVVVSPNLVTFLQQKGINVNNNILVAPNGVNIERFTPLDCTLCKNNLNLNPNIKYIGFIGSLTAWQGVDDLIIAYSQLPINISSHFHLLIVGDGLERKRCVEMSQQLQLGDSVIFMGAQPYSSIPQYMGACSVLVAPKKPIIGGYSPLKIYEYMACARPILASNVESLKFIEEQGLGILFAPGDVNDLTKKLQTILNLPEDRLKIMGERGRQSVVAYHSWDSVVRKIRQFIFSNYPDMDENMDNCLPK
jgi:glycosyltransferase involved in cell wall biosynthesis